MLFLDIKFKVYLLSSDCEDKSITVTSGLETETLKMNRLMVFNKIVKEDLKLLTSIFMILPWIFLYLMHILNVRLSTRRV